MLTNDNHLSLIRGVIQMPVEAPRRLWALLALSPASLAAAAALAQDTQDVKSDAFDEIVVTSSRIRQSRDTLSNPVVAIDADTVQQSGTTSLSRFLKEQPALVGSYDANDAAGSNAFIGGTGLSLLNLRNLGYARTLVLVDGRRHVASLPGTAAVDVDTIPIALVERIDIQTGGASAIYGADGVSGVVNFVMKKDFEGVDAKAQFGRSARGDAESRLYSVAAGHNFAGGRGNVSFALEHASEDRLHSRRRSFASTSYVSFVENPADPDDDPNVPDRVPMRDVRFWDSSPHGGVFVDEFDRPQFNGDGTPFDIGTLPQPAPGLPPISPYYQQGGDGTPTYGYLGDLLPQIDRYTGNLFVTYELAPAAKLFGELKYSRSQSYTESSPTFDFFLELDADNPYVPSTIAARAAEAGVSEIYMSRDHFDLGIRSEDIERDTFRSVLGIGGDLTDRIRYEASYVYGETKVDNRIGNNRFNDRFAAAIDAVLDPDTGEIVCRSNLDPSAVPPNLSWMGWDVYEPLPGTWAGSFTPGPNSGCVPINLFGHGSVSKEAAAWIMNDSLSRSKIKQHVVQAYVAGDTGAWFQLPAGAPAFAFGAEWREESSKSTPPLEDTLGLTFGNVLQPTYGRYDVSEVFAEVSIPLLQGKPFAERLSLDGAVRLSDYSTTGSATTWKTGVVWAPIADIALRATVAEATRAPNIDELFDPGGQDFEPINDPCDISRLDEGSSTRAANCAELLTRLGADPTTFVDLNSARVGGISRGNPDLEEEVAKTKTIGVVVRPRFAPNLTLSVDWYDIELTNAISVASANEMARICVDSPTIDNDFCGLITREPGTGRITSFVQSPLNVARFTTEGYDFTVDYRLETARIGAFDFRLVGSKLEDLTYIHLPGSEPDPEAGEEDAPEWQANFDLTWQLDSLLVSYGINYFSETYRYSYQQRRANPDMVAKEYRKYDARFTHDLQVRYGLSNGVSIFVGVDNLTNQKPDIGKVFYPVSAVGRYWYLGATFASF